MKKARRGLLRAENGKYFGKLDTLDEVKEFREKVVRSYKHRANKNIKKLTQELIDEGYDIHYMTVRTWVLKSGANVVVHKKTTQSTAKRWAGFTITQEIDDIMNQYASVIGKSDLVEYGLRMLTGMPIENAIVVFMEKGNVLFYKRKSKILAIMTADFNADDERHVTGLVNMAEKHEDWVGFLRDYARAAALPHYPPY